MKKRNGTATLAVGLVLGMMLGAPGVQAAENWLKALPSENVFYVDGQRTEVEAYVINGTNYVKLRDIGKAVGFNVYWDGSVQIDTAAAYTGEAPAGSSGQDSAESTAQEIIRAVNALRQEHDLPALEMSGALMDGAQACAEARLTQHGETQWRIVAENGWPYGASANLTWFSLHGGTDIARKAMGNWENSPAHLQTMLRENVTHIGAGVFTEDGTAYCVLLVGSKSSVSPLQ